MDIALLDLISTEPAYLDSIPISPGRLIAVSHDGSSNKGELYWDAEDGTRKCIGSDISEIEALLGNKADLVDGKVKKEQLPEIQTDQVVEQPDAPTSPNTILWVDTDEETPGVDIEAAIKQYVDEKILVFPGLTVEASAWTSWPTYSVYGYEYGVFIPCEGVTPKHRPDVAFSCADSISGNFAPIADSGNGGVYVYCKQVPTGNTAIDSIVCIKGDDA